MAGGYGSKKNGVRIGVFWDGIEISADGSKARITDARVNIDRDVNIVDTSNKLSVSGGAVVDDSWSNINVSGSGSERIKSVSESWVTLQYGSTTTVNFNASMSGIDYAGGTVTASESVTFPARTYALPAAPTGFSVARVSDTSFSLAWTIAPTTAAPISNVVVERSEDGVTYAVVATLGAVSSYSDTGTVANKRYYWRIKTTNTAGASAYVVSVQKGTTPTAPTAITNTYVSDTQVNVAWTNNSSMVTNVLLERITHNGTWIVIATLPATANSYQDYALALDTRYQYRVRAVNLGVYSGYATAATWVATTPKAPSNLVASKSGSNITLTWTNNSASAGNFEVWHAANGVWDGAALATVAANVFTYTHTGVNTAQTHQYRVRARSNPSNLVYSDYATSAVVQLLTAPLAPTISLNKSVFDASLSQVTVSWVHNAVDSTPQTAAEARISVLGANTWTTDSSITTATSKTFSTPVNGNTYEIQVRTKGSHADFGPWSASKVVKASAIPTVTADPYPAYASFVDTNKVTIGWTYFDASSTPQSAWEIIFNGTKYNGDGATNSFEIPQVLTDDTDYTYTIRVWDGDGQASLVTEEFTFHTDFPEPPKAVVLPEFNAETGTVAVGMYVPVAGPGEEEPVSAQLYRKSGTSWDLIADNLDVPLGTEVVQRVNYFPIPYFDDDEGNPLYNMYEASAAGWTMYGNPFSASQGKTLTVDLNAGTYSNWGAWFLSDPYSTLPASAGTTVTAGDTITASIYVSGEWFNALNPASYSAKLGVRFHDGNAWIGAAVEATTVMSATWTRISVTTTVPAGATKMAMGVKVVGSVTVPSYEELLISSPLVEVANTALAYFDGGFTSDTNYTPQWFDVANNGPSKLSSWAASGDITAYDYIPELGTDVTYKVVTWTDLPTSRESDPVTISTAGTPWLFINGGTGFQQYARIKGNPAVEMSLGREKVLHTFAGRTKPVEFIGGARRKEYKVSGDVDGFGLHADKGTWTAFEDIADLPAPLVYRDPMGRKAFVSIGDVSIKHDAKSELASVDMTLTEVDYDES